MYLHNVFISERDGNWRTERGLINVLTYRKVNVSIRKVFNFQFEFLFRQQNKLYLHIFENYN